MPLSSAVQPQLPATLWPAGKIRRVPVTLIRSECEQAASILVTSFSEWSEYAVTMPDVRLRRWQFAVSSNDTVIVRGAPLPSIRGQQFREIGDVAIPLGWACSPAIEGPVLTRVIGVDVGDLAVLSPHGTVQWIPGDAFVAATRSAIRLTQQAVLPHE